MAGFSDDAERKEYEHTRAAKIVDAEKPTANSRQIGGEHYRAMYQHWDFVSKHRLDYYDGNASKYIARAYTKGDAYEQFRKAEHYVQKKLELLNGKDGDWPVAIALGPDYLADLFQFAAANQLSFDQTAVIHALLRHDYYLVNSMLLDMLAQFPPQATAEGKVGR